MAEVTPPPDHVLSAFGCGAMTGARLAGSFGHAWRYGDVVLKPAIDPVATAWASGVFESLRVSGIRVPRPVRSLDGRWVVGGWCAQRFVSGRPASRYGDTVQVSFLLHRSLSEVARPRFLADRADVTGRADRLAWGEALPGEADLSGGEGADLWRRVADGRGDVGLRDQLIHGDLFGNVLFAGSAPPAVVDFNPLYRPAEYAAAIVVVDAVAWGGVPPEFAGRWAHLGEWDEMVRRAVLFRLAMTLLHPRSTAESTVRIMTAATALVAVDD